MRSHTNVQQRSMRIGSRTFTIRSNAYDNVYAYIGSKRVDMFFGSADQQWQAAEQWLADQVLQYGSSNSEVRNG